MAKLTEAELSEALAGLPGWEREGATIRRMFSFSDYPEAIAFVVRLGFAAESADHHPDLLVSYKRVTVTYTTHSDGGLTRKDVDAAATADRLARRGTLKGDSPL